MIHKKYGKLGIKVNNQEDLYMTFENKFNLKEFNVESYVIKQDIISKEIKIEDIKFGTIKAPLISFCLARSGDKGDSANIGK